MPLPLLHLPLLVGILVIDFLTPLELLKFTQISQKRLKIYTKSVKIDIKVYCGMGWSYVALRNRRGEKIDVAVSLKAGLRQTWDFLSTNRTPVLIYDNTIVTYWVDFVHGMRTLIDFLLATFNVRTTSLYFGNNDDTGCYGVLEHVKLRGLKLNRVKSLICESSVERAQGLLTYFSSASELSFLVPSDVTNMFYDNFRSFSLQKLNIMNAHWITVDMLCDLVHCIEIEFNGSFRQSKLTSQEMNLFLKRWLEGCELERVSLRTDRNLNVQQVMDGIDPQETLQNSTYTIQRSDGIKARVIVQVKELQLIVLVDNKLPNVKKPSMIIF